MSPRRARGGPRIAAPYANECPRCGRDMESRRDMVKTSRGTWIHRSCASGGDDE